jgi:hypothetical protein
MMRGWMDDGSGYLVDQQVQIQMICIPWILVIVSFLTMLFMALYFDCE